MPLRQKKSKSGYTSLEKASMMDELDTLPIPEWAKKVSQTDDAVVFLAYGQTLKLLKLYALWFLREWDIWTKSYLPNFSLKGCTVLDVGAGCGETAFFYFLHGAGKVIAIEPNEEAIKCLTENAKVNGWNVEVIPEKFKLDHLKIPHDFMKMDIDGAETALFNAEVNMPCVVEVHNNVTRAEFEKKGFTVLYSMETFVHVMGKNLEKT
jgi:SAM-dependent methyltransferase